MSASELLDAALAHHALGRPVIPVKADKKPACEKWGHWRYETQTESEVHGLFERPVHGIAVLPWPGSDLAVLDFDGPHAGAKWEATGITLPLTAMNRTRSGGAHLIYRVPPDTPRPGREMVEGDVRRKVRLVEDLSCGCEKSCGVDLLVNGYFIVPPTPGYQEDPDAPFEPGNIAIIPKAVLDLARAAARENGDARAQTDLPGEPIPHGRRNAALTSLAGTMRRRGMGEPAILAALLEENSARCQPALSEAEVRGIAVSISRYAPTAGDGRPAEGTNAQAEATSPRFSRPLSELLAVPDEPIPFLIERLLVASANGFIGGEPKSLKSWLALYLGLCLALGVPVFGRYGVKAPVRVLYLQEEDGERRVRRRVRKILAGLGVDPPADEFFRYSVKVGLLLDDKAWLARLRAELTEYRPGIVVGDVFELMHTRDGDRRAELKPVFYSLDRMREDFGCGFLLADHFKKASLGASKRGGQRLSGTVGKHAWGENSLYLFPLPGKNRVRVETELKDAPSEAFALTLEDTSEGGVAFRWEAEGEDREAEAKAKILAALEGVGLPGEWVKTAQVAQAAGMSENTARKYLDALVDVDRTAERERRMEGRAKPWYWRLRGSGA